MYVKSRQGMEKRVQSRASFPNPNVFDPRKRGTLGSSGESADSHGKMGVFGGFSGERVHEMFTTFFELFAIQGTLGKQGHFMAVPCG